MYVLQALFSRARARKPDSLGRRAARQLGGEGKQRLCQLGRALAALPEVGEFGRTTIRVVPDAVDAPEAAPTSRASVGRGGQARDKGDKVGYLGFGFDKSYSVDYRYFTCTYSFSIND